jgi:AraC-like DNA-binding protein
VHAIYLRLLLALLAQRGVDGDALLADAGLNRATLANDDAAVGVADLQALVSNALQRSGSPWLGLELGAAAQPFSHGAVGFAAISSGSLRQALEVAVRYIALRAPALRLTLQSGSRDTRLLLHAQIDSGVVRQFVLEAVAVMLERMLQAIAGRRLDAIEYCLPWSEPAWSRHYAAYLAGRLHFGATRMTIRFPDVLLDAPCISADPQAFALARQECERRLLQGASERDLASRIRRQLWQCEGTFPDAQSAAERFGLSLRSLHRNLAGAGCRYQELLDEARQERACRLLRETDTPIHAIAERLGFADASNFSRCFRRWCGVTPRDFRAARR